MLFISKYRGYNIFLTHTGGFVARKGAFNLGGAYNTAWSAIVSIDETLSP